MEKWKFFRFPPFSFNRVSIKSRNKALASEEEEERSSHYFFKKRVENFPKFIF